MFLEKKDSGKRSFIWWWSLSLFQQQLPVEESFIAQVSGNIKIKRIDGNWKLFKYCLTTTTTSIFVLFSIHSNDILNDCDDLLAVQLIQPNHHISKYVPLN